MPYRTGEQRAERDELVARILAAVPGGLTQFEVSRRLRALAGLPTGVRTGNNTGRDSLRRLEEAGRVRSVEEPYPCPARYRRVYHLIALAWLVLMTHLAVGDCCGFPDSKPPWPQG